MFNPEQIPTYPITETEEEKTITGEDIWSEISAEVHSKIENFYRQEPYNSHFADEDERQEEIESSIAAEHQFLTRVWEELLSFTSDNPYRVNLLFDIDETIGKFMPSEDGGISQTMLRPTAAYLLDRISKEYQEKVKMGFLTTRGGNKLEEQLDDPEHLQPIAHDIDRSILFSTRNLVEKTDWNNLSDVALYNAIKDGAEVSDIVEYCQDILDPQAVAEKAQDDYLGLFRHAGDRSKTSLLARLVRENPDQAYMVVDDFPYPSILKKDNQHIRGVWLDEEAAFYV